MINKISKTEAIKAKMKQEGKVTYLDQPKHIAAIVAMNEQENFRLKTETLK